MARHYDQRSGPVGVPRAAISRPSRKPSRDLYLVAFDLLHLNGHDLRNLPVEDRREILQELLPASGRIQFSEASPALARPFTT
ncbi:ATP-dependent DNA ligase [Mesorhizobium sp. Cs1321R2N1]|uniref:ATP-dependent DNA ligase n=1 Tax=Mesorhizobium sp. Cs1321R2N1 TaxID=3015174 RepID=UPI00301D466A